MFHALSAFRRRLEIEDHDAMKMGVVARVAAAVRAERSASRLAVASRTNRVQEDSLGQDGPPRFASC